VLLEALKLSWQYFLEPKYELNHTFHVTAVE